VHRRSAVRGGPSESIPGRPREGGTTTCKRGRPCSIPAIVAILTCLLLLLNEQRLPCQHKRSEAVSIGHGLGRRCCVWHIRVQQRGARWCVNLTSQMAQNEATSAMEIFEICLWPVFAPLLLKVGGGYEFCCGVGSRSF